MEKEKQISSSAQSTHTRTFLENSGSEMAASWLRFRRIRDVFSRKRVRPILQRTRREGRRRNPRMRIAPDTRKGREISVEFYKHCQKLLLHDKDVEAGGVLSTYTAFVRHARGCGRMAVVLEVSTSCGGS